MARRGTGAATGKTMTDDLMHPSQEDVEGVVAWQMSRQDRVDRLLPLICLGLAVPLGAVVAWQGWTWLIAGAFVLMGVRTLFGVGALRSGVVLGLAQSGALLAVWVWFCCGQDWRIGLGGVAVFSLVFGVWPMRPTISERVQTMKKD